MLEFWLDDIFGGFESGPFCCLLLFLLPTFWSGMWEDQGCPGPRARPGSAPAVYLCCDVIVSKEKDVI